MRWEKLLRTKVYADSLWHWLEKSSFGLQWHSITTHLITCLFTVENNWNDKFKKEKKN